VAEVLGQELKMEGNYHGHRGTESETWVLKESMN